MKLTKKTLNDKIKNASHENDTEVTRKNKLYYILHICKNGTPVPLFYSEDITEVDKYLDRVLEN